jgi:hypothetical protein
MGGGGNRFLTTTNHQSTTTYPQQTYQPNRTNPIPSTATAHQPITPTTAAHDTMCDPSYPLHWGQPPMMQTMDYRPLPGGFGMGSSSMASWIQTNLDTDGTTKTSIEDVPRSTPSAFSVLPKGQSTSLSSLVAQSAFPQRFTRELQSMIRPPNCKGTKDGRKVQQEHGHGSGTDRAPCKSIGFKLASGEAEAMVDTPTSAARVSSEGMKAQETLVVAVGCCVAPPQQAPEIAVCCMVPVPPAAVLPSAPQVHPPTARAPATCGVGRRLRTLPPPWLLGQIEPPAATVDMGCWVRRAYTLEQQSRLGIDENGTKPLSL